jgi:hypothetical protein
MFELEKHWEYQIIKNMFKILTSKTAALLTANKTSNFNPKLTL